jgi:DNA-binding GntR family transcriptional regulator
MKGTEKGKHNLPSCDHFHRVLCDHFHRVLRVHQCFLHAFHVALVDASLLPQVMELARKQWLVRRPCLGFANLDEQQSLNEL